ncbi:sugar phosphate nucleotidyltransferase [Novosphingobium sp. BL-8H]|uniref:glucose-1-phosphate adenylyltransferase family protein n=1 Tax=Novosphingobium sp. BL-8H TaxID=3127640 RepID=UPI0037584397
MESAKVVPSPDGVLSIILAGGKGSRLHDLTDCEAKPAIPIGPNLRLIDFTLANVINSGLQKAMVLTQHAPATLHAHLERSWQPDRARCTFTVLDGADHGPFAGTAHAVACVIDQIDREAPEHVVVLAGDHLYQMDYRPLVQRHIDRAASVTVGVVHVPVSQASEFGILAADASDRITAFVEKPRVAPEARERSGHALASMGIYVFDWKALRALLNTMGEVADLDFGKHIVPHLVTAGTAFAYALPGRGDEEPLWQDLGTLDAYHAVQMKLASGALVLDPTWPVASRADDPRSNAGGGSILRNVAVLPGGRIGRWASISNAIVTGDAVVPDGFDLDETIAHFGNWCVVSPGGIRLISARALRHLAHLRHQHTSIPARPLIRSIAELPAAAMAPVVPAA